MKRIKLIPLPFLGVLVQLSDELVLAVHDWTHEEMRKRHGKRVLTRDD